MKKTIYILSILTFSLFSCDTDHDISDQGISLQDLDKYVAFSIDGTGITLAPIEVTESDGETDDEVNVEIPGGTVSDVVVNYTFSGTAIFGTDFTVDGATSAGGSVTIDYNNTPNIDGLPFNADINVKILSDGIGDGVKTLDITLVSASNAEGEIPVGRAGSDILKIASIIISDDDYVAFDSDSESITASEKEGTTTLTFEAFPGASRTNAIDVEYSLGGTAVFGVDYTIAGATATGATITIPAPTTAPEDDDPVTFDLEVEILSDSIEDGDKTIEVTLVSANDGSPLSVGVGGTDTNKVSTITINDATNSVAFSSQSESIEIDETEGTTNLTLELHSGVDSLTDATVNYSFGGSAIFGVDYTITGATAEGGSIVIPSITPPTGMPSTVDLVIDILTDALSDGDKTLTVSIDSATLADMTALSVGISGSDNTSTIAIEDVDFISFNEGSTEVDVNENDGNIQVTLEALTNVDINLNYSLGGTAVYGVDYTITGATSSGGSATIIPNAPVGDKSTLELDIQILTDGTVDGDKTIVITVDNASQTNGTPYTIIDNISTITIEDVDM